MFRVATVLEIASQDEKLVSAIKDADGICSASEVTQTLDQAYQLYLTLVRARHEVGDAKTVLYLAIKHANNQDALRLLKININEAQARQKLAEAEQKFEALKNSIEAFKQEYSAMGSDNTPRKLLLGIKIAKLTSLANADQRVCAVEEKRVNAVIQQQAERRATEKKESEDCNRRVVMISSGAVGGGLGFFAGAGIASSYNLASNYATLLMIGGTVGGIVVFLLLVGLAYSLCRSEDQAPQPQPHRP